jgi:hypothetical protein
MDERRISMFALMPLWIAMIGGSLTVAAWALDSSVLSLVGVTMFVLGVILVFVAAMRDSRRSGIRFGLAVRRSAWASIRFAFKLMP